MIFKAHSPVTAMASDGDDNILIASTEGDVLQIFDDGQSDIRAKGLNTCGFSFRALSILPSRGFVTNDCINKKDVIVAYDRYDNRNVIAEYEHNIMDISTDRNGKVYVADWRSKGDLSVALSPNYLQGADRISGHISMIQNDGTLQEIFEGGLPVGIDVDKSGAVFASIWGNAGTFRPKNQRFSIADPRHFFFIALSDKIEIAAVYPKNLKLIKEGDLTAVSSIALSKSGILYVYGISTEGGTGIYTVKPDGSVKRMNVRPVGDITALTASERFLYFANRDGEVYRVKQK